MDESALRRILFKGLSQLSLAQPLLEEQQDKLINYILLLYKWNKTYNLTAVRDPEQMVIRHILDSLAICRYLRGNRILDVGTGAGIPGIPLAICSPNNQFTLLDTNSKKTRFVTQAVSELELPNAVVVQSRVENFQQDGSGQDLFNTIISRAYSAISTMLNQTNHLLEKKGIFLAMKGAYPDSELSEMPGEYQLVEAYKIDVPMLNEERYLLEISIKE